MIKAERYGGELFSDLVGNHSTVARQNGWPGGDKKAWSMAQRAWSIKTEI